MCGIIGYTGSGQAVPYLLKGLELLEYRGYDSAGIAVTDKDGIGFCKCKGRVSLLKDIVKRKSISTFTGIGHTRWATHGVPSTVNAHPHLSENKKFAVVHNGIIENHEEIRNCLINDGYSFESDTDTEVIAHLLEKYYTNDTVSALIKCTSNLRGSYALAVVCSDFPDEILCIRHSSPLVVCENDKGCFLSSDVTALSEYTNSIYRLEENCPAVLSKKGIRFYNRSGHPVTLDKEQINLTVCDTGRNGYEHYMLKEIMQQPQAIKSTVESLIENTSAFGENLSRFCKVHIIACGSAYHVGLTGKYVIENLCGISCESHIASEFRYGDIPVTEEHLCIVISQSGETADSLAALKKARQSGGYTVGIVNVQGSSVAQESDRVVYTKAGPEIAVATTKAYSAQLCAVYLIGAALCKDEEKRNEIYSEVKALSGKAERTIESTRQQCEKLSDMLKKCTSVYFIGRNTDYPVAMEGALKLKEISYINSSAYPAGELKHGTISLIEKDTVVIAVMTNENVFSKTLSNVREVQSRGATVIFVTSKKLAVRLENEQYVITVESCHNLLTASLGVIPLQFLSYYTAKALGRDIDKPRNLAKSVTVE